MRRLACSFFLSLGLCLTLAHIAMAQQTSGARLMHVWSGTDEMTTEPFRVQDDVWNLEWVIEGKGSQATIIVRDDEGNPVAPPVAQSGPGTGRRTLRTGPGTYTIEIDPGGGTWLLRTNSGAAPARVAAAPRAGLQQERTGPRPSDEHRPDDRGSSATSVQACRGIGSRDGQGYVGFGSAFGDGVNGYSLVGGFDASGPITIGVSGTFADVEDSSIDAYGAGVGLLAEIPNLPISVCPGGGVSFLTAEELDVDFWSGTAGVAIGGALPLSDTVHLNLFASPDLLVVRGSIYDLSDTETEFAFSGGLAISGPVMYAGGSVSITTIEGSDPTFSVGAGLKF